MEKIIGLFLVAGITILFSNCIKTMHMLSIVNLTHKNRKCLIQCVTIKAEILGGGWYLVSKRSLYPSATWPHTGTVSEKATKSNIQYDWKMTEPQGLYSITLAKTQNTTLHVSNLWFLNSICLGGVYGI